MKKACLYIRVSSKRQVDGYSLTTQENVCRKEAEKLGCEVIKVYREEGISGKNLQRPQFEELLQYVRDKKDIHYLICYHTSRIARNSLDFLTIQAFLAKYGCTLHSATEPISGQTPESKFLSNIMAAVNQLDNEIRARNISGNLKTRFLSGDITVKPPIGYLLEKDKSNKSHAVKDPIWFPIIKNIWKRTELEGLSLKQAVVELNKYNIKHFTKGSIEHLFRNKFYAGILVSKKYGEVKGHHPVMITLEAFYKVKAMRDGRSFVNNNKRMKYRDDFMLRGLLCCSNCGRKLTSAFSKGEYKRYGYYYCLQCDKRVNIPKDRAETEFINLLKNINVSKDTAEYFTQLLKEEYEEEYETLTTTHDWILKDIAKLQEREKTLNEKLLDKVIDNNLYLKLKDELNIQLISKRSLLSEKRMDKLNIDAVCNFLNFYLQHLDIFFIKADPQTRYLLGSSIFPENLIFDNGAYRTPIIEQHYQLIPQLKDRLSPHVSPERVERSTNSLKGCCSTIELRTRNNF